MYQMEQKNADIMNAGNAETRQHYEDLVVRIKEALNIR